MSYVNTATCPICGEKYVINDHCYGGHECDPTRLRRVEAGRRGYTGITRGPTYSERLARGFQMLRDDFED